MLKRGIVRNHTSGSPTSRDVYCFECWAARPLNDTLLRQHLVHAMLFNSIEYLILLSATLACYWASPSLPLRRWIILGASIYFYMSWSKVFMLMLLGLIIANWLIGWTLAKSKDRLWVVVACILNLGLLAFFKYMNFFLDSLAAVARLHDPATQAIHLSIILPLGISFYVFELISYQVDIYRGKVEHERSLVAFSIFVLFFPHLIAGPICRPAQLIPQLHTIQRFDGGRAYNGLLMFLAGLALKSCIADGLSPFVNVIFNAPAEYSGLDNFLAMVGFGVQILCDFWGYSLMALGAALLFGYVLPHNFNLPYASVSIRDFWRRWHITLSRWLRDYLYIPLGGARTDLAWKVQRNLMITMVLGGLWHGASWNFILWGTIHGGALAINRWFENARLPQLMRDILASRVISWLLTMSVVFVAWIFFRAANLADATTMISQIATPAPGWGGTKIPPVYFELLLLYVPLQWLVHRTTYQTDVTCLPIWKPSLVAACFAAFTMIYYVDGNEFIYFQF